MHSSVNTDHRCFDRLEAKNFLSVKNKISPYLAWICVSIFFFQSKILTPQLGHAPMIPVLGVTKSPTMHTFSAFSLRAKYSARIFCDLMSTSTNFDDRYLCILLKGECSQYGGYFSFLIFVLNYSKTKSQKC